MRTPWHIDMRGKLKNRSCYRERMRLTIQEAIRLKEALYLVKIGLKELKEIRDGGE